MAVVEIITRGIIIPYVSLFYSNLFPNLLCFYIWCSLHKDTPSIYQMITYQIAGRNDEGKSVIVNAIYGSYNV